MTRWLLRLGLMIIGVGLGIALAAAPAQADSTPLGKGVEKALGDLRKVSESVGRKKPPQARPKAARESVRRPAAKPAKRVVRSTRPQAKPVRIPSKPRARIVAPARKRAAAPVRNTIKNIRPMKIVKRAPTKINKSTTKKVDKPRAKKIDKPRATKADQPRKKINKLVTKAPSVDDAEILLPAIELPTIKVPALELPTVALPAIDLPAIPLPPLPLLPGNITPVPTPPIGPEVVTAPPTAWSIEVSQQPTMVRSADSSGFPATDRIRAAEGVVTPAVARATPVRSMANALAVTAAHIVEEILGDTSALATPTSVGTVTVLVVAAVFGLGAASSARGSASGWAGLALLPTTLHLSAVGAQRRFSAALRLSAWRISYNPAFAPD